MQVQSIGNYKSHVKFSSDADTEKAKAFVNMDDSQLKTLAYIANRNKFNEKKTNSINSTLYAIPIVASISSGILTKGKLGTRVFASARTATNLGVGLLALGAVNAIENAVVSRSEKLQKFENNHPLLSLVADLGLALGAFSLGTKGARKILMKTAKKFPKAALTTVARLQNAKKAINKTMLNTKVLPKIQEGVSKLGEKAPWAVEIGAAIVDSSVYILFLAGIMRGAKEARKEQRGFENNYKGLKMAQLETAKHLTNVLAEENNLLTEGSPTAV